MKRIFLLYCGMICAMLALADDNNATLWVGESHTFSVPITYDSTKTSVVYWENMHWDYESESDSYYYTIDAIEASSTDEQATATVCIKNFFPETKHVVFRYTEVKKMKIVPWSSWTEVFRNEKTKTFNMECNKVGITINPSSMDLQVGESKNLQWQFSPTPPAGSPLPTVSFRSSNNEIATVAANGRVTGKSIGKATITAETNYATTATCEVNVTPILSSSISIEPSSASILEGSNLQLHATILPENTSNSSVTWTSNNNNVATVDANGLVTAKKRGNATITAKTSDGSNISANCSIRVLRADVNGDGDVNVTDVVLLIDMLTGAIQFD